MCRQSRIVQRAFIAKRKLGHQVMQPEVIAMLLDRLGGLAFEERRVLIDQGHKLTAAISQTVAVGAGAIAGTWRSHYRQPGYDYREDHKERDGLLYTLRGNWALEKGLMKPGPAGYYEDVTAVGEEVFCRCWMVWFYNLSSLPPDMLTAKGKSELARVRISV